jgi:hypothetical protein
MPQGFSYFIASQRGFWSTRHIKPMMSFFLKTYAVHKVIDRLFEAHTKMIVIYTCGIDKSNIILSKADRRQWHKFDPIGGRIKTYWRMDRASESMEKAALDAAILKKLTNIL